MPSTTPDASDNSANIYALQEQNAENQWLFNGAELAGLFADETPQRDTALLFRWHLPAEIAEDHLIPCTGNRLRDLAIRHVVAEGLAASATGQRVSYSRSKNWYTGRGILGGPAFTFTHVVGAVDMLASAGLIDNAKARPCPGGSGVQSVFTASEQLVRAFGEVPGLRYDLARPVLLRAADGSPMPVPNTREMDRVERRLRARNEAIQGLDIRLDATDIAWTPDRPMLIDGRWYDPRRQSAHIVYNGDTRHGGRLYGLPYQVLNQRDHGRRQRLLIDGEPVAEPDFSGCHPRLLYHEAGLEPDGDLYDVPHPTYGRNEAKLAMQVLLNARSARQGIPAFAWKMARQEAQAAEDDGDTPWTEQEIDARARAHMGPARDLADALIEKHGAISGSLFTGVGARLQHVETEIMTAAAMRCLDQGVTVLPMHDSAIVPASQCGILVAEMHRAYVSRMGHEPRITGH